MTFRYLAISALFVCLSGPLAAQSPSGRVVVDSLYAASLENRMGESPKRALSVYLPPGYDTSGMRYPVVYFLHGFMGDHSLSPAMQSVLDGAIATHRIRPFILVIPNERTSYDGSFYSNSGLFGNWEDFTARDLVQYIDGAYRTLARPESRGITGHSMGGYGALKLAMHHPNVFSSVYALSPGALAIVREYGPNSNTFRELSAMKTAVEIQNSYFPKVMVAFGRAWSPNPDNPPFYADFPFTYSGDSLVTHPDILAKWHANMPVHMIEENLENLQHLRAIALDWGRNAGERFTQQCQMFSRRLENAGITHTAEEYIGTHVSGIFTPDGRVVTDMLPFFNTHLRFVNSE